MWYRCPGFEASRSNASYTTVPATDSLANAVVGLMVRAAVFGPDVFPTAADLRLGRHSTWQCGPDAKQLTLSAVCPVCPITLPTRIVSPALKFSEEQCMNNRV